MRKLFWLAAVGGGLYWASRQPGGVPAVWNKFSGKLKRVQDADSPLEAARAEFLPDDGVSAVNPGDPAIYGNNRSRIEPATSYSPSL